MGATAFRCYEIDLYRQDHGAVFERELDEMRKASPEWPKLLAMGDAAQNRRERLLASFQRDIVARWRALKYVPGLTSDDENTRLVTFADLLTVSYGLAEAALVRDRLRIDMANRRWSLALGPGQCCPSCAALVHETAYRRVPLHAGCACKMLTASMIPTHGTFR
jgi:hypothetical protein